MADPFLSSLNLSEEQLQIYEAAREIGLGELKPRAKEIDENESFPEESIRQLSELGFMGILIPEDYDGMGMDMLSYTLVIDELSYHCASTALIVCVHSSVGANPINTFGSQEQKKEFLPKLASGEIIGAFALTEPDFGSDAASITTSARKDGNDWILDGRKMFITNASEAGIFIVIATADKEKRHKGLTAFIVPADTPGLSVGRKEEKMGMRGSDTCELLLDSVRLSDKHRLGNVGDGFKVAMITLDGGRIGIGAQSIGIARAALDEATEYAKTRVQFGRPIAKHQAVQFKLATMATRLQAARHMVYDAARRKDAGKSFTKEAAMAKLFASETCNDIVRDAVQIFGGYGYTKEYVVERLFRDAKITEIYEGTSEMQRLVIARELLR